MRIKITSETKNRYELAFALEFVLEDMLNKAHAIAYSETKLSVLKRRELKSSILINERLKTDELINDIESNIQVLQTLLQQLKTR